MLVQLDLCQTCSETLIVGFLMIYSYTALIMPNDDWLEIWSVANGLYLHVLGTQLVYLFDYYIQKQTIFQDLDKI